MEELKMSEQKDNPPVIITTFADIPYSIISDDINQTSKDGYFKEMKEIKGFYEVYEIGAKFLTEGARGDYLPSSTKYKKAASILNKEARFMFAKTPDFNINPNDVDVEDALENTIIQSYIDKVLEKTKFKSKLLKACKDCLIGKRIALVANFNEDTGITLTFLNAFEFLYETSSDDADVLTKFVSFCNLVDTTSRAEQRYFKKTYTIENGYCYIEEGIYDGLGVLVGEEPTKIKTLFTYIPAVVIRNDGLTGDLKGKSEISYLMEYESKYSKLANADIDAERKSMNPVAYTVDASSGSTRGLSSAPGSFWDIQSDDTQSETRSAQVGILESAMSYSTALKTTLDRLENTMYSEVDVPNVNSEQLQGVITSGKTLKALYWGLTVRCDEKMLVWSDCLVFIIETLIDGARLYPAIASDYSEESLPDVECQISVVNNYPLPEDEVEEKNMDLAEIGANAMSRKSYLKKWKRLSDKQADAELEQIKKEMDLFENSMLPEPDDGVEEDFEEDVDTDVDEDVLEDEDDDEIDSLLDELEGEL